MSKRSPSRLLVHIVWSTKYRHRILDESRDERLTRILARYAAELGCELLTAGCAPDHVHVLVRLAPTVPLATLVQRLKGGSSHDANVDGPFVACPPLRWQAGYWAESFGPEALVALTAYVREQRDRHKPPDPSPWTEVRGRSSPQPPD